MMSFLYHSNKKIKIKRRTRSPAPPEVPSEVYAPLVSVNYYNDWPEGNYNPVQYPSCVPEESVSRRGMSNSKAFGLVAAGIISVVMLVGGAAKAEPYLRGNNAVGGEQTIQVVSGQNVAGQTIVTANPVESYMRYWKFQESVISALKPLGYKGYWDTNDKALVDIFYYLPDDLKNNKKLLSYAASIASDGSVSSGELSEFMGHSNSLKQQLSQQRQVCSLGYDLVGNTCVKQQETQIQQYNPQDSYPYPYQQQPDYNYQQPSYNQQPSYQSPNYPQQYSPPPSQSYPSGPSSRPDSGGSTSSGGPLPRDMIP